jgi:threonine dehydratase
MRDPTSSPPAATDMPERSEVGENRARIDDFIVRTPVLHLDGPAIAELFGAGTELFLKLETFQPTGAFKVRGVLSFLLSLDRETLARGLVTMSSGNHAAAVAWGAGRLGTSAKVVLPRSTDPRKVALSARYGATPVFVDDFREGERAVRDIEAAEGRTFVPAWGDRRLLLGTASIGLELLEQCPPLDAFLVAIGGGSICAGAGSFLKQARPQCQVLAVEPEGAPTMFRSFASGEVEYLHKVDTIAEGLAPPCSCPMFTRICRACVEELRLVSDRLIVQAMRFLFDEAKLAVEPSGAGAMAGALGPFRERIAGRRAAIVVSGSNIDFDRFSALLATSETG